MKNWLAILFTIFIGVQSYAGDTLGVLDQNVEYSDTVYSKRLAAMPTSIEMSYNSYVKNAITFFTEKKRKFVFKVIRRKNLHFETFESYLHKYKLPEELKYLSVIESGLNAQIRSGAGAVGLWQFMPATGRMYKLKQDYYIDERMDPEQATEAACKYLKYLHDMFGDWHLALAAYNAGPGNVRKAIRRSGYKESFWEIYEYLPRETRFYVPKFIAMNYVMNYPEAHNFLIEDVFYPIKKDTLVVNQYFNLEKFSKEINFCLSDLVKMNPSIKRNVIPLTHKGFVLNVPADKKPFIEANRKALMDSAKKVGKELLAYKASVPKSYSYENKYKYVYRVKGGDVLGSIASRHGVSVRQIKYWNNLYSDRINIGQKLNIYKDPKYFKKTTPTVPSKTQTAKATPVPANVKGKIHTVQPGDTLWFISKKYGVTVEQLKKANGLKSNALKPGQKLKLG